jgi:hypothetical protein
MDITVFYEQPAHSSDSKSAKASRLRNYHSPHVLGSNTRYYHQLAISYQDGCTQTHVPDRSTFPNRQSLLCFTFRIGFVQCPKDERQERTRFAMTSRPASWRAQKSSRDISDRLSFSFVTHYFHCSHITSHNHDLSLRTQSRNPDLYGRPLSRERQRDLAGSSARV